MPRSTFAILAWMALVALQYMMAEGELWVPWLFIAAGIAWWGSADQAPSGHNKDGPTGGNTIDW